MGLCVQFQIAGASSATLSLSNIDYQQLHTHTHTRFVRTANADPLPVLCLKIDLFLNDLPAPQSSRLEDRRVYSTNCSPGLPEALSPPPSCTCGCARPASIPFRVQMAAGACSRDKRPPCTPPVKQRIRLIDMQAALLLQSRGGSFTVERAGRQIAGATV